MAEQFLGIAEGGVITELHYSTLVLAKDYVYYATYRLGWSE